jgi:hypothetical protein
MEWQAGYCCGALLMPLLHVRQIVTAYQETNGLFGAIGIGSVQGQALIQKVQQHFQVSADAARIRLLKLNVLGAVDAGPSLFSI